MPGPEMFVMKLAYARHWAATAEVAMSLLGPTATLGDFSPEGRQQGQPSTNGATPPVTDDVWVPMFLNQYAIRLGGGTDEVQRNIIGEQGLGLPREPSVDRGVPWKELARA